MLAFFKKQLQTACVDIVSGSMDGQLGGHGCIEDKVDMLNPSCMRTFLDLSLS